MPICFPSPFVIASFHSNFDANAGASGSSEIRRGEQFGIRSECEDEGPGLRLRWGDFLPAKPGFRAPNATGCCSGRDPLHPDAARADSSHISAADDHGPG